MHATYQSKTKSAGSKYQWRKVISGLSIIVTVLLFSILSSSHASSVSERTEFRELLFDLQSRLFKMETSGAERSPHDLLTGECDIPFSVPPDSDIIREQSYQAGKISGLELRGAYSTGSLSDSNDEDSGLERGRGNVELSWDILKQGYRQNALRANALELQAQKADLLQGLEEIEQVYRCRRHQIRKEFSGLLIQLLDLKLQFLEPVYQVERRAYFKQWSFLDDYLVSEEDLLLTRHELNGLLADPYHDDGPIYQALPPIIDIDLAGLLTATREDESYTALFVAEKDWMKAEQDAVIRDSLRVYLRQEFDVDGGGQGGNDLVAGLRFRIPLYSRKSNVLNLKLNNVDHRKHNILWERIAQTRSSYTKLQEQLRRTIKQHYRHARAQERLRRTMLLLKGDDKHLTTAVTRMKTLIEARLELVRAKEELYRRCNEMFLAAQIPYRSDLVKKVAMQPLREKARPGKRSIYIWSNDFNSIVNDDLLAFLEAKQISKVLLSAGRKTDVQKRDAFLEELQHRNIDADLIIGDNSWIFSKNHEKAVEKSVTFAEKTGRLHFDIEPQALPDYRENREEYLGLFTDLITEVENGLLDRHLSLAVPFHWPMETYRELGSIADKLYIMAYGTTEPQVILRRIAPILEAVPHEKIVIVLRTDDFQDEWAIEKMIERLLTKTAVEQFCIHNLGSFIKKSGILYETEN